MSSLYISSIIDKVMEITGDPTPSKTNRTQMVRWLNEGERTLVMKKPEAYTKTSDLQLVEGTKQSLPSDGILLLRAGPNMGTNGSTFGDVAHMSGIDNMDRSNPSWHSDAASATVNTVLYDTRDPKAFYVHPPQPSSSQGFLRYTYSAVPPELTITADNYDVVFNLGDEYESNLMNYILFRIYSKDKGNSADAKARAVEYYSLFLGTLTEQDTTEATNDPNIRRS